MTAAQTASGFEDSEALIGRPVTEDDVAPLIWGIIQKGKAIDGPQHYRDVSELRQMSRDLIAEPGGLRRPPHAGHRPSRPALTATTR